jgi:CubicO group peptidase (beta-lactamase class C family)
MYLPAPPPGRGRRRAPPGWRRKASGGRPPDSFFPNGNYDQTILISPAERLIIVRFGFGQDPDQDVGAARISRLAGTVVAALHNPKA